MEEEEEDAEVARPNPVPQVLPVKAVEVDHHDGAQGAPKVDWANKPKNTNPLNIVYRQNIQISRNYNNTI